MVKDDVDKDNLVFQYIDSSKEVSNWIIYAYHLYTNYKVVNSLKIKNIYYNFNFGIHNFEFKEKQ